MHRPLVGCFQVQCFRYSDRLAPQTSSEQLEQHVFAIIAFLHCWNRGDVFGLSRLLIGSNRSSSSPFTAIDRVGMDGMAVVWSYQTFSHALWLLFLMVVEDEEFEVSRKEVSYFYCVLF